MKEIILKIPDNKYDFFVSLLKNLGFVKFELTVDGDSKEEVIKNIKQGFEEMKLIKEGKLKGTPLKDFLDEL